MRKLFRSINLMLLMLLTSCNLLVPAPTGQIATPSSGTLEPAAEVLFLLEVPQNTPEDADIELVLLDPATDLNFNTLRIPMEAQGDGKWAVTLTPVVGSLLYYRYEKIDPGDAIEVTAQGTPVNYRTTLISSPGEVREVVARWSDEPFQGQSGRMLGQILSAKDGQPLNEMLISVGGQLTFTDGEGRFRVDDLPAGQHSLTVFSPTGSFIPYRQEALIAANRTTPANIQLEPAEPIIVTFQVRVPADTPEQATLHLTGNIAQLGFRYKPSEYGSYQSISQMPTLVRVDPENYLGVFTLYSGTYLQYKYTLGDGVWNAERSDNGAFATRSVTIRGENPTVRDQVISWSESAVEPIRFAITTPEETPPGDEIAIQFKAGNWRAPLPMWPQADMWTFTLYGPKSAQQDLEYRFCRNMQCGAADEAGYAGQDAGGRPMNADEAGARIEAVIEDWQWLDQAVLQQETSVDPLPLTNITRGGVEFTGEYDPTWIAHAPDAFTMLGESNTNEVILSPAWTWTQNNPFPVLELDPATAPLNQELKQLVDFGRNQGMHVALRPSFRANILSMDRWWLQATRDQLWWDLWFEEYRSFILTYANWAQQNGVEKLIIGGPEVIPALPFGLLPDGNPSGVPVDSEARWRELMTDVREQFAGQLAFELEFAQELSSIPPFIDLFDQVHLYWHSPIGVDEANFQDIQQATIKAQLDRVLDNRLLQDKPVTISIAYLSLENSADACPPQPDGSCRALTDFSKGKVVDIDLERDLEAQAQAYDAILRAIADEPRIQGVFSRGFYPAVILHDKSLSVYGKPAQDVLAGWLRGIPGKE